MINFFANTPCDRRPDAVKPAGPRFCSRAMRSLHALADDRTGAAAVILAISLSGIIGFAGLGTEVVNWYYTKRTIQGAVDTAAATAAAALAGGAATANLTADVNSVLAKYNLVNGSNGVTVTVNSPPTAGTHRASNAVEVIVSKTMTPLMSGILISTGPTLTSRAVAQANTTGTAQGCVVALDSTSETSVTVNGSATPSFSGCSLYINSPSSSALTMGGSSSVSAANAFLVGNVSGSGLTTSGGTFTGVNAMADPYLSAPMPTYSGCDQTNYKLNAGQSQSKSVGASGYYVFCRGITLLAGSTLTLGAGTFIIDRDQLTVSGGATLSATSGTTIVLTSSDSSKPCATVNIQSNATVNITAPNSGSLSGLALFQDRACTDHTANNSLTGGATQNITGALYFPNEQVSYTGGGTGGGAAACTQLVAWSITFSGSSNFANTCTNVGTRSITLITSKVVE